MPKASVLRILVVDDQASMRSLVRTSLSQLGFVHFVEAEDGEDALRKLRSNPAHLIFSDLNMPKLDGLGLLKAVREAPDWKGAAFIMLTSRGDHDLVRQAIALGVNNYLIKPFSLDSLKRKVEAVVGTLT